MEKRQAPSAGGAAELAETKIQSTLVARDVDIGQILETHATPEMERKVLLKLDL